jgi:cation:H+ antiporter
MDVLYLLAGIAFAVGGAHYLVEGGSAIAKRFNIPTLVIGSTIVAFGTSMPEFTVNINSALAGNTGLAFGNILGSNLFNICVVVGVVALITPIVVGNDAVSKDLPMCLIGAAIVGICGNQIYFDKINYHELFFSDGAVFLLFFAIFMRYVYGEAAAGSAHVAQGEARGVSGAGESAQPHAMLKAVGYVLIGLVGLVVGGEFIVDGASGIARSLGMAERTIGLVIVGPGTSVPELIASIAAALRKDVGMVLGNVLGSNIFNIFFTLGATALIMPIPLDLALNQVIIINVAVTALLVGYTLLVKEPKFGRSMGALLLVIYVGYIANSLMTA